MGPICADGLETMLLDSGLDVVLLEAAFACFSKLEAERLIATALAKGDKPFPFFALRLKLAFPAFALG